MTIAQATPQPRPQVLTAAEQREAGKMSLRLEASSPQARQLVLRVLESAVVPAWPADIAMRPKALAVSEWALAALLGDLLTLQADGKAGSFGMSAETFTPLPFGATVFKRVKSALEAAGLLKVQPGYQHLQRFPNRLAQTPGDVTSKGGQVTRFMLTAKALEWAEGAGVCFTDGNTHWKRPAIVKPVKPSRAALVVKRAQAERAYGVRGTGAAMPVNLADADVAPIAADLAEHNAFVANTGVGGLAFTGLRRIFNNGDQPGFAWRWGGRFYSASSGDAYERWNGETRRSAITLGGERVGEADIRASHLSLFYALQGLALDPGAVDPYSVPGVPRDVVKMWIAGTFGRDGAGGTRWSGKNAKEYAKAAPGRKLGKDFPIAATGERILAVHPVLGTLGRPGVPNFHDLQFHESEVLRIAMAALRRQGVASLPVHDSLIVPAPARRAAQDVLADAFRTQVEHATGKPSTVALSLQWKGLEGG